MNNRTLGPQIEHRPLPPSEMDRLAGERIAELACEVDNLRREVYGSADGVRVASDTKRELREAGGRVDGCRRIMERAQWLMEGGPGAEDSTQAAWAAASETIALAFREERDLTCRRAEFSYELFAQ